jgi:hypothetical protein
MRVVASNHDGEIIASCQIEPDQPRIVFFTSAIWGVCVLRQNPKTERWGFYPLQLCGSIMFDMPTIRESIDWALQSHKVHCIKGFEKLEWKDSLD